MTSVSLAKRKRSFSPLFAVADIGSRLSIKKALAPPAGLTKVLIMDDTFGIGMILGHIGKIERDLAMTKALQYVLLKELAKSQNLDFESLIKDVEKMHAQYVLQNLKDSDEIERDAEKGLEDLGD